MSPWDALVAALVDLDRAIMRWVNLPSRHALPFDESVMLLSDVYLLRTAPYVAAICWLWWRASPDDMDRRRAGCLRLIMGSIVAVAVSRLSQLLLPSRLRPMSDPALEFLAPYGVRTWELHDWSSFPSDHAVYFVALSVGLHAVSPAVGRLAYLWTALGICLPRLYLGYHFPTDLLGGAALGFVVGRLAQRAAAPERLVRPCLALERRAPGLFYTLGVLWLMEMATMFDDTRKVLRAILALAAGAWS